MGTHSGRVLRILATRRGRFDIMLVWAFDRVARSVKHFLEVLGELNLEYCSSQFPENIGTVRPSAIGQPDVEHPRPRGWISPLEWRWCEHRPNLTRMRVVKGMGVVPRESPLEIGADS
jgi:hypothetical protein